MPVLVRMRIRDCILGSICYPIASANDEKDEIQKVEAEVEV